MNKMAVIAEPWTAWGFAGLGLSVYPAENEKEAQDIFKSMEEDYAIIFVSETFYQVVKKRFESRLKDKSPLICLIPNNKERKNLGHQIIREVVRQAVGFEI